MKHTFALILALVLISTFPATAQVSVGINGGLNLNFASAKVAGRPDVEKSAFAIDNNAGAHVGGFVKIPLSDKFHFKPGLTFVRRGGGREKERVTIYFADVPITFGYAPAKRISVEASAVLSYRLHATAFSFVDQARTNVTSTIDAFCFGASAGINFSLSDKWLLTASAYRSFVPSWDISFRDQNNKPDGKVSYYLSSIGLGLGYQFK